MVVVVAVAGVVIVVVLDLSSLGGTLAAVVSSPVFNLFNTAS